MNKKQDSTNVTKKAKAPLRISSEELALGAKGGDDRAFEEIARRYEMAIKAIASTFNVPPAEKEDLCQEGLIALYRAACKYDESIAKFSTFAKVCITRAMLSWVRDYVSHVGKDGREITEIPFDESLEAILSESGSCPEDIYISRETVSSFKKNAIKKLSDYEKCVFLLQLEELSTAEICESLGKSRKSVENAIDRIRAKLSPGK